MYSYRQATENVYIRKSQRDNIYRNERKKYARQEQIYTLGKIRTPSVLGIKKKFEYFRNLETYPPQNG